MRHSMQTARQTRRRRADFLYHRRSRVRRPDGLSSTLVSGIFPQSAGHTVDRAVPPSVLKGRPLNQPAPRTDTPVAQSWMRPTCRARRCWGTGSGWTKTPRPVRLECGRCARCPSWGAVVWAGVCQRSAPSTGFGVVGSVRPCCARGGAWQCHWAPTVRGSSWTRMASGPATRPGRRMARAERGRPSAAPAAQAPPCGANRRRRRRVVAQPRCGGADPLRPAFLCGVSQTPAQRRPRRGGAVRSHANGNRSTGRRHGRRGVGVAAAALPGGACRRGGGRRRGRRVRTLARGATKRGAGPERGR